LARRAFLGASFQPTGVVIDVRPEGTGEAAGHDRRDPGVDEGRRPVVSADGR
jgi:hypothetical protein